MSAQSQARALLHAEVAALIERLAGGGRDEDARRALLSRVVAFQRAHVAPVGRLMEGRGDDDAAAVPTDVFRFARVSAHPASQDARTFLTSGTTSGARGAHHLRDLSLYDRAAEAAGRYALFPEGERLRLLILAPGPQQAPESSLSYMLGRFVAWFGSDDSAWAYREDGTLDLPLLQRLLSEAERGGRPVALLGTSFAFVHAEDALGAQRFSLPAGSRLMQTGGFKGRSRQVAADALLAALSARYAVPEPFIVQEYGMTELSSQLYELSLRQALLGETVTPRRLWAPGWVGVQPVDGETLRPVADGARGILRVEDLANLDSAAVIQTADLAERDDGGVRLFGRAADAMARGCSLSVEEALAGARGEAPQG